MGVTTLIAFFILLKQHVTANPLAQNKGYAVIRPYKPYAVPQAQISSS